MTSWTQHGPKKRLLSPIEVEVGTQHNAFSTYDVIFTANTLHIMSEDQVKDLIVQAPTLLRSNGLVVFYGPFKRNGQHTATSNESFDNLLKARDPQSGIRDLEWVTAKLNRHGFNLIKVSELPSNNLLVAFKKK